MGTVRREKAAAFDEMSEAERQVFAWRLCEFGRILDLAGAYDLDLIERLATSDADLHRAAEMVAGGCSPALLARILV